MRRGGYLARVAGQSGVVIRAAAPLEPASDRRADAPAGLDVDVERSVAPAAPLTPVAEWRAPPPSAALERIAAAASLAPLLPPPNMPGQHRASDEEAHPVVRVGEVRLASGAPATGDAVPAAQVDAPQIIPPAEPLQRAHATVERVSVLERERTVLSGEERGPESSSFAARGSSGGSV